MDGGYRWDVFVSYPHESTVIRDWVREVFVRRLRHELGALGLGEGGVFCDRDHLEVGEWPRSLAEHYLRSKVIVPVLCYPYFKSGWCRAEWANACARELMSPHAGELLVPVLFNDGDARDVDELDEPYRGQVRSRTPARLNHFSVIVNPGADTPTAEDFRREMQGLGRRLRAAILGAPTWSADWPTLPAAPISGKDPTWGATLKAPQREES